MNNQLGTPFLRTYSLHRTNSLHRTKSLHVARGLALCGGAALLLQACGGGAAGGAAGSNKMEIVDASHGFGLLLPHQVHKPTTAGTPGFEIVAIRTFQDLVTNVKPANPVKPPTQWPTSALLPTGAVGNHYIFVSFSAPIDVASVLDASATAQASSNLSGSISIEAVDPLTGTVTTLPGRAFIGGKTYAGTPVNGLLQLQQWVGLVGAAPAALPVGLDLPGLGFPGTQSVTAFPDAAKLVSDKTFVFVADSDSNLQTAETFPLGQQIRMRITGGVRSTGGKLLAAPGLASATVGVDTVGPEVAQSPPPFNVAVITPGNGDANIDPQTPVRIQFSEPIQPFSLGSLDDGKPPSPSSAVSITFGPSTSLVNLPFALRPPSVYDLSTWDLVPAFAFPGAGPVTAQCGAFNKVTITVNSQKFLDLNGRTNSLGPTTFFTTGQGQGLVNAPVAPDAIYIGRFGSKPGITVIDLNGFGQSTGNPTYNLLTPIVEGNSNFPNNVNVAIQGSLMIPPLSPGQCTINGGSRGVFTTTTDSNLNDLLATSPILESVGDMMLGHALDSSFNNGPPPFGCQSGGGNICAQGGLKQLAPVVSNQNTLGPSQAGQFGSLAPGGENLISWAPHPNPPPLIFPPLCVTPFIGGQEPTSINSTLPPPPVSVGAGLQNLLVPGAFPLGVPSQGLPPSGLLVKEANMFFLGPSPPQTQISLCQPFQIRQQIGHYMYVIDRVASEIVVLNSNRFTLIERIVLPDPTSMSMSPNLDFIAVTNQNSDLVSFVDINPASSTFHTIVKSVKVGASPRGIAWETGNEDILVCNEASGSVSIISAFDFEVRKTITNQLKTPFEVCTSPRQTLFGYLRDVYYGYILDRDGSVALYESGPNGVNGWGYDDVVGKPTMKFNKPKAIQADYNSLFGGCWIVHEDQIKKDGTPTGKKGGAVSNLVLESATFGKLYLGASINPQLRDINFAVPVSVGSDQLTGLPVDIAFDNQMNFGGLPTYQSPQFAAGQPISINGKSLVRAGTFGIGVNNTCESVFMFLAVPNSSEGTGSVDVVRVDSGGIRFDTNPFDPGVQSIPAPGASILMDYFRQ